LSVYAINKWDSSYTGGSWAAEVILHYDGLHFVPELPREQKGKEYWRKASEYQCSSK
jgi:hypothetical protein